MARVDDYINAAKLAVQTLTTESLGTVAERSGFKPAGDHILRVPFLDRVYLVSFPDMIFTAEGSKADGEIPIQEQVLILHYLSGRKTPSAAGKWVSYREIPGASFYYGAFVKRAVDPLKKVFGQNISGFEKAAGILDGKKIEPGDAAFEFRVFPNVPVQLIVWEGDDEFPAEANILFHGGIESILSPEDIAWLAGMVVYRLMALSRSF